MLLNWEEWQSCKRAHHVCQPIPQSRVRDCSHTASSRALLEMVTFTVVPIPPGSFFPSSCLILVRLMNMRPLLMSQLDASDKSGCVDLSPFSAAPRPSHHSALSHESHKCIPCQGAWLSVHKLMSPDLHDLQGVMPLAQSLSAAVHLDARG